MRLEEKRFSEVHNTHKISEEVRSSTWGALLTGAVTFFLTILKKREIIIIYFLERAWKKKHPARVRWSHVPPDMKPRASGQPFCLKNKRTWRGSFLQPPILVCRSIDNLWQLLKWKRLIEILFFFLRKRHFKMRCKQDVGMCHKNCYFIKRYAK